MVRDTMVEYSKALGGRFTMNAILLQGVCNEVITLFSNPPSPPTLEISGNSLIQTTLNVPKSLPLESPLPRRPSHRQGRWQSRTMRRHFSVCCFLVHKLKMVRVLLEKVENSSAENIDKETTAETASMTSRPCGSREDCGKSSISTRLSRVL